MTAAVDICNMALAHCRAGKINSLTEGSLQADQCNLFYEICRNQVLEDAPWGFATKIAALAVLDSTSYPVFNWCYAYQYPSDCIRINRLILNYAQVSQDSSAGVSFRYLDRDLPQPDLNHQVKYDQQIVNNTRVITANDADLRIKYNIEVTDPNRFSSSFILALSHLICSQIAVSVAGEEKGSRMAKNSLALYQSFINNAIAHELDQRYEPVPDSEFITVRN